MLIVQEHFIHTNNWPYRIILSGKYFVRVYRIILCRKVTFEGAKYNYMQTYNARRGVGVGLSACTIGPSGVRALPLAAGINVGGHYF